MLATVIQMVPGFRKTPSAEIKGKAIRDFLARSTMLLFLAHFASCWWIRGTDRNNSHILNTYIRSFYFLIATASTTGYGDVSVDKNLAHDDSWMYVYAIMVILFALNYFVIFIAFNKAFFEDWKKQEVITAEAINELEDWFAVRNQTAGANITWEFEKLVKGYHHFLVNQDLATKLSYGNYYDKLACSMQKLIQSYMVTDLISAFEILKVMPEKAASEVALQYSSLQ